MRLRNKLLLSFILTTFLPILIIGVGPFQTFKKGIVQSRIEELKTIADLRVTKVEVFFRERRRNIQVIQKNPSVSEAFQVLQQFQNDRTSLEFQSAHSQLGDHLKVVETAYGYLDVVLVNPEGVIVYASNVLHESLDLGQPLPDPGNLTFSEGKKQVYLSFPFINDRENDIPSILLSGPLFDAAGAFLGLVVFEIDMRPIYDFIEAQSGLGMTGEILIGRDIGGKALFLNPIRHDDTPVLQRVAKFGTPTAFPIIESVQGRNGEGLSLDYRSKEIIAAWRYIPSIDWGLVAKIDREEVFQEIEIQFIFILFVSIFVLVAGGGIFGVISKSITDPINAIQEGMAKVKQGKIRKLTAADTNARGDVAPLVDLFNEMIGEIENRNKDLRDFQYAINSATIVGITDKDGLLTFVNDRFCEISQYSRQELIGKDCRIINSASHSKAYIKSMWDTILVGKVWRGNFKNKAKDGSFYWVDSTVVPFLNDDGIPYRYLAITSDITQRKRVEDKVFHMAHYDGLTGLPNRAHFEGQLDKILKIRRIEKIPFVLLFLDLDGFKLINDTLGHAAGDELLQEVAKRLKESLRQEDIVARLSGDEFTILLPTISSKEDVFLVARKLIRALKIPVKIADEELTMSCSIGIALFPDHGDSALVLMKNADTAMYHAKNNGRGRFSFYSAVVNKSSEKTLSMTSALYHAIEREELELHYQPILDLNTGRIAGMEALIRWRRPEEGLVPPGSFIPLAEKTGLIVPIGEWVMQTALAQASVWRDNGFPNMMMSVNVAAPQFQQEGYFVESVMEAMRRNNIGPGELKLELTESILMQNQDEMVAKLGQLRASGVQLAIDDFGTGFSSLSYLKRFPIHTLKIDRSFVKGLPEDREDAAITKMIVALSEQLQINVIAEGIETKGQLAYLQNLDCAFGQGYLFSPPIPKEAFTRLLQFSLERKSIHQDLFIKA